jgi:flagellar P-ring protein precursor FlgI
VIARTLWLVPVVSALLAQGLHAQTGSGVGRGAGPAPIQPGDPNEPRLTADNTSVQELCRIQGHASNPLRGIGILTGLKKGAGDSGAEMALARPLAKVYEANHIALPELKDLAKAQTAALVALEVVIPAPGARDGDQFDIRVTAMHSATDLTGGQLILSPLLGPMPSDDSVYAMGYGTVQLEDPKITSSGVIHGGARMISDFSPPAIRDHFILTLQPEYRYYTVASRVADAINGSMNDPQDGYGIPAERGTNADVAKAIDDTSIYVSVPEQERTNIAQFVGTVMATQVTISLLQQPAEVRINQRTGSIIFSGNVEISPVAISHKNLMITTLVPPPQPTVQNPQRIRETMVALDTAGRNREKARIQDLLLAFRTLDVPVDDRINIIMQLHKAGRLHARLVVE